MTNYIRLTGLLICVFLATSAWSEDQRHFLLHTGLSRPLGPDSFSSSRTSGINLGLGYSHIISDRIVNSVIIQYQTFTLDRRDVERDETHSNDVISIDSKPASILSAALKGQLTFPGGENSRTLSYLYLACGYYYLNEPNITVVYPERDHIIDGRQQHTIGIDAGLGVDINIENTILFIELGINMGLTRKGKTATLPLKLGLKF